MKGKDDIDLSKMTEKDRLTMFSVAKFGKINFIIYSIFLMELY